MNILLQIYSLLQSMGGFKSFGNSSIIKFPFKVWSKRNIAIGKKVFIAENSFLCTVGKYNGSEYSPNIVIGNNVTIGSNFFVTAIDSVIIEDNVLISDRVFISDHIHGYENIYQPIISQKLVPKGKVVIKKGSFIGINTVIMPGVTIGEHAVIGASAVVTKNVPAFSVVAGNPAKIIKRYNVKRKKWEGVK